METINYFESLSQIEEDERKWNKGVADIRNDMLNSYNRNKTRIGGPFRDKYFKVIESIDNMTRQNIDLYEEKILIAQNEFHFFSLLCSGADSVIESIEELDDERLPIEGKNKIKEAVNKIWSTDEPRIGLQLFDELSQLLKTYGIVLENENETRKEFDDALKGIYK